MDTSGFYKKEGNMVFYGPNFVDSGSYYMDRETKDNYSYPYHDWYWFNSAQEAYQFFNLELPEEYR